MARSLDGFSHVDSACQAISAIPAAPGWRMRVWSPEGVDDSAFVLPIAAWVLDDFGSMHAVPVGQEEAYLQPYTSDQHAEILPPEDHDGKAPAGLNHDQRLTHLESTAFRTSSRLTSADGRLGELGTMVDDLVGGMARQEARSGAGA